MDQLTFPNVRGILLAGWLTHQQVAGPTGSCSRLRPASPKYSTRYLQLSITRLVKPSAQHLFLVDV